MAEVRWIKIVTDVFDDEKILLIESMPDADAIIVIWFKLLCLAGKQNNSGVFMMGRMPYTEEMFATIFRRPINTVRMALKVFEQFGMIEIINDAVTIPNWGKHQSIDQIEAKNAYMKEYMREYRAKQKSLSDGKSNRKTNSKANVSSLDKNRGEENRGEGEEKKSVKETSLDLLERLASDYIIDMPKYEELYAKTEEWIKYKMERKEKYTETGLKALLRKIENNALKHGDRAVCDLIDESMANGWMGIIFDRLQPKQQATGKQQNGIDFRQMWDEERGQGR